MEALPIYAYTAEQAKRIDEFAIETLEMPGPTLMEQAGAFSWQCLQEHWPDAENILVFCGAGNNGGDGYVLARLALEAGKNVHVVRVGGQGNLYAAGRYFNSQGAKAADFSNRLFNSADVVVDAMFGIGLDRPVNNEYRRIFSAINRSGCGVLALDIPSGINGTTGQIMSSAVKADVTATFICLKTGMMTGDGPAHTGQIRYDGLDIPEEAFNEVSPMMECITADILDDSLEPRALNTHKGHFGHVLVVGGDLGMGGAARMAAEAAARVGAGLVSVATRPEHVPAILAARPELMVRGIEEIADLVPMIEQAKVIAVGPGLGQSEWSQMLYEACVRSEKPMVVDADGLNWLAKHPIDRDTWVLTPHPGEAARLLRTTRQEVQWHRMTIARQLQEKFGGVVVLKGLGSLVANNANLYVNTTGNPGMASGGMGDVLTGIIAGLWAQGMSSKRAANMGVYLHGKAADLAARDGQRGLLAMDVVQQLRPLVNP